MLERFDDRRFQEFGERIIYAEAPDGLSPERRTALDDWHHERHLAEDDVPWLTIKKAQEELAEIKEQMAGEEIALVVEIEEYLNQLAVSLP